MDKNNLNFIEECAIIDDDASLKEIGLRNDEINEIKESYKNSYESSLYKEESFKFNEASVERVLSHGKDGFIIVATSRDVIGANRIDNTNLGEIYNDFKKVHNMISKDREAIYEKMFLKHYCYSSDKELGKYLRSKNNVFSFTPVLGGYKQSYDKFFVVYNSIKGNMSVKKEDEVEVTEDMIKEIAKETSKLTKPSQLNDIKFEGNMKGLVTLALAICTVYHQESVFIQLPNKKSAYYNYLGKKIGEEQNTDKILHDVNQEYFIQVNRDTTSKDKVAQRFSSDIVFFEKYDSVYERDVSGSILERMEKESKGQICIKVKG